MSPNVQEALSVMIMATPFMFGVLTLFSLLILVLGRVPDRKRD